VFPSCPILVPLHYSITARTLTSVTAQRPKPDDPAVILPELYGTIEAEALDGVDVGAEIMSEDVAGTLSPLPSLPSLEPSLLSSSELSLLSLPESSLLSSLLPSLL